MATGTPVYPAHTGFLLAEDEALKLLLTSSLHLPDGDGGSKPVKVWFRFPEAEREITYPFVTMELIGIEPAYDLWTSDYYYVEGDLEREEDPTTAVVVGQRLYEPSTAKNIAPENLSDPFFERLNYLPYRLFYQLTCWTKNAIHDRLLTSQMFRDVILPRPSWLYCPADGVWKRMEVQSWTSADLPSQDGASKRIFRKVFTMSVQTDIPQDSLPNLELQNHIRRMSLRMLETRSDEYLTGSVESDHWETLWDLDE